jgi:carnitine O-acetyltransferase
MQKGPLNIASLHDIETALFVVSLDGASPTDANDAARKIFMNASNRWYDKSLSFIIFANGEAGLNGEVNII